MRQRGRYARRSVATNSIVTRCGRVLARASRASKRAPWCSICASLTSQAGPSAISDSTVGSRSNGGQKATCSTAARSLAANSATSEPRIVSQPSAVRERESCCTTVAKLSGPIAGEPRLPGRSTYAPNTASQTTQSTARPPGAEHPTAKSTRVTAPSHRARRSRRRKRSATAQASNPPAVTTSGIGASDSLNAPSKRRAHKKIAIASKSATDAHSAGPTSAHHSSCRASSASRHVPSVASNASLSCYIAAAVASAALASCLALSVFSQVNSGSLRPK
jgi:hypothetical protein